MSRRSLGRKALSVFALVIALITSACSDGDVGAVAGAADAGVDEAALQVIVDDWRSEAGTFGVTVSIRLPGHGDIHLASGVDDRAITAYRPDQSEVEHTETPMPTDGTFPISYITRTFVAAAALKLVDEGRIGLDEPVTKWLPELPTSDEVTLRALLGYTSGLGEWNDDDRAATILSDLTRSFTPDEVFAKHLESAPRGFLGGDPAPGRAPYVALGLLVERMAGADLASVIHDRFLVPLALDETAFTDGAVRPSRHGWIGLPSNLGDRATDVLDVPQEAIMTTLWASDSMVSSSSDMLDWGAALLSGEVLGETGTATMLDMNPVSPPPVPNRYFGLGAAGYCLESTCDPDDAELVGAPGGGFCCWSTQLVYHRESGTTVVVHTNTNDPTPEQLIQLPMAVLHELGVV